MATPSLVWLFTAALDRKGMPGLAWLRQQLQRAGLPDDAIGTLSQLLGHSVSLVDNEVLVEDLEDLASLEIGHDGLLDAHGCALLYRRCRGGGEGKR